MLNILIPVDGSRSALRAVEHAIQSRVEHNDVMQINLANIQPRLPRYVTRFASAESVRMLQRERSEQAMAGAVDLLSQAGVPYQVHLEVGQAAEQIVACAERTQSHKIMMGTTRKNALSRFLLGSIVNKVMALTDLPVEVVARGTASKFERFGAPVGLGLTFLWLAVE
ncbi:MAG TPA: universal stress protein [Oxalicibacterium sp.]|jgi:nucleotide-binding universal stress UspA family protein|nr:universal stress protein [Oxalicibacterium sp.]